MKDVEISERMKEIQHLEEAPICGWQDSRGKNLRIIQLKREIEKLKSRKIEE